MRIVVGTVLAMVACSASAPPPVRPPAEVASEAAPAVTALQAAQFADAQRAAMTALAGDPANSRAAAVRALARYAEGADGFGAEVSSLVERGPFIEAFEGDRGRALWTQVLETLDAVDADLAIAERDPAFSLELCLACWPARDWNHDGHIDDRDRRLFELDLDGSGAPLPASDPRRKPTFRFDHGDILWARAMVHFQHAIAELVLAYQWTEVASLWGQPDPTKITIALIDKARVIEAREDLLAALDFSAREREAYLAETDDDREWVPSPRQHSHPIPLAMDDAIYSHWSELLADTRRLLTSDDGISLRELATVTGASELHLPDAYLDIGKMFREPQDIVVDFTLVKAEPVWDELLPNLLGHGYTTTAMHPTPMLRRIAAMAKELDHGDDTLERKLHYLIWLN